MAGVREEAARTKKALAYADALQKVGGTALAAAQLPDAGWELARQLAGWKTLPSAATKAMVVTMLAEREAGRDA